MAMLAGVVLALLLSRRITSPMASLVAAAPLLGRGDPAAPLTTSKVSEVRELARALHHAGEAIREREARQKKAEEALRAADRAKDEFLAMLGHELRNPLATLSTAAQLLKVGAAQPGVIENAQALIARQTGQMAHLVDDLLEVSRVTGGKIRLEKQPVDLAEVAAKVVSTWRAAGRLARHRVAESLERSWILADAARMEQIASNLLDNAVKYTPEGGSIEVRVRGAKGQAMLEVADDGQGLAPGLIDQVFDLFVQGERGLARQQGGLGIGLTLVRRLAELHGGAATAASDGPGRGTTFTVRFPSIQPPAARAAPDAAKGAAPGRRRVLIVEDNTDGRESLARLLELIGHEVAAAPNGAEGLRLAAATRPQVALIDIGLPDLSGYEVARRLKETPEGARMSLIALTGYGKEEDRARALASGFDEHLTKPVALERLERLLAQLPVQG
jgi:signal transduction histidine kinase